MTQQLVTIMKRDGTRLVHCENANCKDTGRFVMIVVPKQPTLQAMKCLDCGHLLNISKNPYAKTGPYDERRNNKYGRKGGKAV